MPLRKRDLGFIIGAGGVLLLLSINSLRDKPRETPANERHRPLREALARGDKREAVEKGCTICHGAAARPLPPKHPPKEQCLLCHALQLAH